MSPPDPEPGPAEHRPTDPAGRRGGDGEQKPLPPLPSAFAFAGMGLSAATCVAVGVVLGIVGDDQFHTSPALLVVGLIVGVAAAVMLVAAQVRRYL